MGRNRIRLGVVVLAMAVLLSGCAAEPTVAEESGSASPRPTASESPSPTPDPTPTTTPSAVPEGTDGGDSGHDHEEHAAHPPADPSLSASTAYSSCVAAARSSLFADDPAAAYQPLGASYVEQVDGVWRVHSGVATTSAEGAGSATAAYCQVSGSESAPSVLTVGVTLAPPSDPGLWALPEG